MRNTVPATRPLMERGDLRLDALSSPGPTASFAPSFTRPVGLAVTSVTDELGRPLLGVFVPDGELL